MMLVPSAQLQMRVRMRGGLSELVRVSRTKRNQSQSGEGERLPLLRQQQLPRRWRKRRCSPHLSVLGMALLRLPHRGSLRAATAAAAAAARFARACLSTLPHFSG